MSHFYSIDSTRVTHREYWWGSRSPLVLVGWMTKWLRIRIPSSSDDANVDSTLPFVVDCLPAEVEQLFRPTTAQLEELGFHSPVYQVIFDPGTQTTLYWATFLHHAGSAFARIHHRVWQKAATSARALFPMFFSEFNDGTFLVSSAGRPDMAAPETVAMNRMPRAKPAELWKAHLAELETLGREKTVFPIWTGAELLAAAERQHVLVRDFHLTRGVFRERTELENSQAEAFRGRIVETRAQGLEHGEVLAELDRLQDQKPGWAGAIWILIFSVIAFTAAGASRWDWKFTLLLLPILFFHEAGHWVAMRIFGYRNLRMFFIPLFGAAVTGRNWNVAGWKKALVSLAGPLPGIALGIALGIAAIIVEKPWLTEAAVLLIFLNGFNLLPILPLDGGHVVHATLFCRNRWLDIAFRVLAIVGLVALGFFAGLKLLPYLAIPMALALPVAFKLGKVTDDLRALALPPPPPGQDRIPTQTAQAIISAVKAALPPGTSTKNVATYSLSVFETLNARPPNVFATLGLLSLHGGAIAVSIVFAILLIVHKSGGLEDFFSAATRQPDHAVDCESVRSFSRTGSAGSDDLSVLVTTFEEREEAEAAFNTLTNEIPANSRLLLFGDSVLLTLVDAADQTREQWLDAFRSRSTDLFVALTNQPVDLSITFVAPSDLVATNLEEALRGYYAVERGFQLIPPWSPAAAAPEFAGYQQARLDWLRITESLTTVWSDPGLTSLNQKISKANRRGSVAELQRLRTEQQELFQRLQDQVLATLRLPQENGVNPALLDLHAKWWTTSLTNQAERAQLLREIAGRLGTTAPEGLSQESNPDPCGADSGFVSRHGLLIEIRWSSFRDPSAGLPAFVKWICGQGCEQLRYDLSSGFDYTGETDFVD